MIHMTCTPDVRFVLASQRLSSCKLASALPFALRTPVCLHTRPFDAMV